jgi:hypothetical protein
MTPPRHTGPPPARTSYEVRITLRDLGPPVRRLVRVRCDATLGRFHGVIQAAMGWMNCHLHGSRVKGESFSDPELELDGDEGDEFRRALAVCPSRPGDTEEGFLSTYARHAECDRRFEVRFDPEAFDVRLADAATAELSTGRRWERPT